MADLVVMVSNDVSSVIKGRGIRGRVGKSSGLLASGKHTSRYGGFSSNGNNNKRSARNIGGWVSNDVSSVRNGKGIRGRVGKSSGLLASGKHTSRYGGFSSNGEQ